MRAGILLAAVALALAACGVDGEPTRPSPEPAQTTKTGITISGSASAGVKGRF